MRAEERYELVFLSLLHSEEFQTDACVWDQNLILAFSNLYWLWGLPLPQTRVTCLGLIKGCDWHTQRTWAVTLTCSHTSAPSEPCLPCQASGIGFSSNSIHFSQDKGQEVLHNEPESVYFLRRLHRFTVKQFYAPNDIYSGTAHRKYNFFKALKVVVFLLWVYEIYVGSHGVLLDFGGTFRGKCSRLEWVTDTSAGG